MCYVAALCSTGQTETLSLSRSHSSVLRLVDCHLFYLPVIHAPLPHSGADATTVVLYTMYRDSERERVKWDIRVALWDFLGVHLSAFMYRCLIFNTRST